MDEIKYRELLSVPADATAKEIEGLIKTEGYLPCPVREKYGDDVSYACTVIDLKDPEAPSPSRRPNEVPFDRWPTPTLAALNGLRVARGIGVEVLKLT
jgi:hypothetical protein